MSPKYESDFTQRVIEAIENARLDAGMSVQELIEKSGIRRSTYFRKMRGENTFDTEDVDTLAKAMGLDPFVLLRQAANVGGMTDDELSNLDLSQGDFDLVATEDHTTVNEQDHPNYEDENQDHSED